MMAGVRLHHSELRNVTYTITNYAVPLKAPMFCWSCSGGLEGASPRVVIHDHKTFHLNINAAGDVVVAEELVEMMHRTGLLKEAGLAAVNGIVKPEMQVVQHGTMSPSLTVDRENGVRS
jgi:hypothetical protein